MPTYNSIQELEARQKTLKARVQELDAEHAGRKFPADARAEWNTLNEEIDANEKAILEHRAAYRRLEALSRDARHIEREPDVAPRQRFDYSNRQQDALRAVDRLHSEGELPESAVLRLDHVVRSDVVGNDVAYIAAASDPHYRRAFGRMIFYGPDSYQLNLSDKEREAVLAVQEAQRAASLTTTAGGFAVPIVLDPTVIPTSSGSINPLRQIARVETVTENEWRGVTSAGITAAYSAEATEASDNAPTLAQPIAYVEKAQAFVPFSIEIGQDWATFGVEMARMFADAKDSLEASKFITGVGHTSNEPAGLFTGATAVVATAGATTLAIGDVYGLKQALPARWRTGSSFLGADVTFDKIRRLVGDGNTTEVRLWEDAGPQILRRPAYEQTSMPTAVSSGASILTIGDFSQFLILDRIGMQVELIPHLFATGANLPSGQRGLYAYWRSSSKVLTALAFKTLKYL